VIESQSIITELGALSYVGIWITALLSNIVIPIPEEVVLLGFGYLAGTTYRLFYPPPPRYFRPFCERYRYVSPRKKRKSYCHLVLRKILFKTPSTEEMRAEAVKLIAIGETCRLVAENYIECMEDNEKLIKLNDYLITQQEINLKLCDEYKDWVKSEIAYSDRLFKQVVTWTIFITIYSAFAIWYLKG
jgi:hypothetical protein